MMAQWRIKEISDLTGVSVRTLHHYDQVGLLRPSVRASNGYRWYSEQDLATLQQIIALKFFGFGLEQIKTMLQQKLSIREHLCAQKQMLANQAEHLRQSEDALDVVLQRCATSQSLDWNDLVTLIERYRMSEDMKKTWAGKLNDEQFKQYLELRQELPKEFKVYDEAVELINSGTLGDPEGPDGQRMVKIFEDLSHKMKNLGGRLRILNADLLRSAKEGKLSQFPMTPEGGVWVAKASLAYHLKRCNDSYQDIVQNLSADPEGPVGKRIAAEWRNHVSEAFTGMPRDLGVGLMLWQEMGRQQAALKKQTTPISYEEQIKGIYVPLYFNPEAMAWIEKALNKY
ncbi:MAG: MerR family transcriptional regulator [Candidatus Babeliales bacterium]